MIIVLVFGTQTWQNLVMFIMGEDIQKPLENMRYVNQNSIEKTEPN